MLVGITGGIGSGKTTVAKLFAKFENVVIYFADQEAKQLMNTSSIIKEKIIANFSSEAYVNDELNRKFLSNIVFNNKEKLHLLNSIVHPEVFKHLQDFREENADKDYILYENAILFENGSDKLCDKIITVTAPVDVRIQRVVDRDKVTKEEVMSRINNQWIDMKKILQSNYVIHNMLLSDTENQVSKIHNKLT